MSQSGRTNVSIFSIIGTEHQPIRILDEQEEQKLHDKVLEQSRNNLLIQKALLSGKIIEIVFAIVMTKFRGEQYIKLKCLKDHIAQYFFEKVQINIFYEYFTPRFEPNYSSPSTRPFSTALIVHGVDFMDTRQIGKMFLRSIQGTKGIIRKITWINESNVFIVFVNAQKTLEIIQKMTSGVKKQNVKIQAEVETNELSQGWFELNSYDIHRIERKLFARYATTLEVDIKTMSQMGRYHIFQTAQKGLQLYLLTKFQVIEDFQAIMKQMQYESFKNSILNQSKKFSTSKPSINQAKFNQYMAQGRKQLNLQLNFQGRKQPLRYQKPTPKVPQTIQISQSNEINVSFVGSSDKNGDKVLQSPNKYPIANILQPQKEKSAMVNQAEQNFIQNKNILQELNNDKGEAMVNEEADVQNVMALQLEQAGKQAGSVQKPFQAFRNVENQDILTPKSQSSGQNYRDILHKINEVSLTNNPDDKSVQVDLKRVITFFKQIQTNDVSASNSPVLQKHKQSTISAQNHQKSAQPTDFYKKPTQTVPAKQRTQEQKKSSNLNSYQPLLLNVGQKSTQNQNKSPEVKEQKKVNQAVANKQQSYNNGNGKNESGYQNKPQNTHYEKKDGNNRNDRDFKGKPNQGSTYQKNQPKVPLLDDQHYEPSSY